MCIEVTNITNEPTQVIYSQVTIDGKQTRHRQTIPAKDALTIRYAASVEVTPAIKTKALPDFVEPAPEDGPID